MGPLKRPEPGFSSAEDPNFNDLPTTPGMGAELVVIECLRGNFFLCEEVLPRDLFETFGELVNECPGDPSKSPFLDFFLIACQPAGHAGKALPRNQAYALEVFLSDKLPALRLSVETAMGVGLGKCELPGRLVELLSACVAGGNAQNSATLQQHKLTMEAGLNIIETLIERNKEEAGGDDDSVRVALLGDRYLRHLVLLFSSQMENLVVDPRLFRRGGAWELACFYCRHVLVHFVEEQRFATLGDDSWPEEVAEAKQLLPLVLAALKITRRLIEGARHLGVQEFEVDRAAEIRSGPESLLGAALDIHDCALAKHELALKTESQALVDALDSGKIARMLREAEAMQEPAEEGGSGAKAAVSPASCLRFGRTGSPDEGSDAEEEELNMEEIHQEYTPANMLQFMAEALENNPNIVLKLQKRRFQFAEVTAPRPGRVKLPKVPFFSRS